MKTYGFGLGAIFAQRTATSAPHSSRYPLVEAANEQREGNKDDSVRSEGAGDCVLLERPYEALLLEDA